MVQDVYSGDEPSESAPQRHRLCRYVVITDLEPFALAQVVQPMGLTNVAPTSLTCVRIADERLQIVIDLREIAISSAELLRRKLDQLTCVHEVALEIVE